MKMNSDTLYANLCFYVSRGMKVELFDIYM